MSLAHHATYLRDLYGMAIHPVKARDKAPVSPGWQARRWTEADLLAWYADHPDDNMGLVCGATGFVALDLDGNEWVQWADNTIPPTPLRTVSGSGEGGHRIYRWPIGVPVAKRRLDVPGLPDSRRDKDGSHKGGDLYGDGTQIVLPPSIHPSGGRYRWLDAGGPMPPLDSIPVFDLSWLPPPRPEPRIAAGPNMDDRSLLRAVAWIATRDPAVQGQRGHDHTYATCCFLVAQLGLSESDAWGLLVEWNRRCLPPWSATDLRTQLRSALRGATGLPFPDREPPARVNHPRVLPPEAFGPDAAPLPPPRRTRTAREVMRSFVDELNTPLPPGTGTGIPSLDQNIGSGFQQGELVVIGARMGVGKSLLGLQFAEHAARQFPVLYISAEMRAEAMAMRAVTARTAIPLGRLRGRRVGDDEWSGIHGASADFSDLPLHFMDSGKMGVSDLDAACNEVPGLGMLCVDYAGLIDAEEKFKTRHEAVATVAHRLLRFAVERKIVVVAMAQLNREVEGRATKVPTLADLADSDVLARNASLVLLIKRELSGAESECPVVRIAKNRNGLCNDVLLRFHPDTLRFEGLS